MARRVIGTPALVLIGLLLVHGCAHTEATRRCCPEILRGVRLGMSADQFERARPSAVVDTSEGGYVEAFPESFPYFREGRYVFRNGRLSRVELRRDLSDSEANLRENLTREVVEMTRFSWGAPSTQDVFTITYPGYEPYAYDRFIWAKNGTDSTALYVTPEDTVSRARREGGLGVPVGITLIYGALEESVALSE